MQSPDIFISYARADEPIARRFAESFAAEGFNVWWDDELRSGEFFDEAIETALRAARAVVVLWSPHSVSSRWVRAEATLADRNKTLIPAMIAPCDRPIIFELTHTADLCEWEGESGNRHWAALLQDIRSQVERAKAREAEAQPPPVAPSAAPPVDHGPPALAIMPFANRSGREEDELFADGMLEDLVAAISTIGELKVIASSATRSYRDTAFDARQAGRELGVTYLLEGNLRRVGKNLRVTAQLVESHAGEILWTQRFDRPLEDLDELQEDLVLELVGNLGVQVIRAEIERALKKPDNMTAYQLMVRALRGGVQQTPESLRQALDDARKAVELAPDFARAHAQRGLIAATFYWQLSDDSQDDSCLQEVREAVKKAIRLDPNDPRNLTMCSQALCNIGNWDEGLRYAERAVEINPDLAASHVAMTLVCAYYERADEMLQHLEICDRLVPRGPDMVIRMIQKAGAYFMKGDYESALEWTRRLLLINPNFIFGYKDMVINLAKLGRHEEAIRALADLRENAPFYSLGDYARVHKRSMLSPRIAQEFQDTLAMIWHEAEASGAG